VARTQFPVEVLTPEGLVFEGEVEMVSTRTGVGSIGVLANHAPVMAILEPAELRLYKSGSENPETGDAEVFAQGEGYLQVIDNSALLVVEEAIPPAELDRSNLETKLKEAQERLDRSRDREEEVRRQTQSAAKVLASPEHQRASEELRRAEAAVKRYETFLEIAGSES
jgi:F-type H+-transporting ATPase subunit epsilon